jgi:hypothetical protein
MLYLLSSLASKEKILWEHSRKERKEKSGFISKLKECILADSKAWIIFKISQNTKTGNYLINHFPVQSLHLLGCGT